MKYIKNAQGCLVQKLEEIYTRGYDQATARKGLTQILNHNHKGSMCQKALGSPLKSTLQITENL